MRVAVIRHGAMHGRYAALACVLLLAAACGEPSRSATTTTSDSTTSIAAATSSIPTTVATTAPDTVATSSTFAPSTTAHVPATKLVLVGDSLAVEASIYLPSLLGYAAFAGYDYGGTAACDWFDLDMGASPSTVVVLSFHGNVLTPCVQPPWGGPATVGWIVAKYRKDVSRLIDMALAAGSDVVLVGQPENGPSYSPPGVEAALNEMYAQLAAERGIGYVDAGAAVETGAGEFTRALPCLPEEPSCDTDGMNTVRSPDGVHFCPVVMSGYDCPVYSSGAYRYAKAIAALATVI